MTQTLGGMSFRAATVELSADGVTYTDVSSEGAAIAVTGGDRAAGDQNVFGSDVPISKAGKRGPLDIVCRFVYSESATEAFEIARAIYETAGAQALVRWSPSGGSGFTFRSGTGFMTTFMYPQGEAGPGAVVPGEFTVHVPEIFKQ